MTAISKFSYLFINLTAKKCTKKREKRKCFSYETHCLFDVLVTVALFWFCSAGASESFLPGMVFLKFFASPFLWEK